MARFKVRKATKRWMVWDTQTNTVARVDGLYAVDLSAETANRFAESLNRLNAEMQKMRS
jgi:hypothetical protein